MRILVTGATGYVGRQLAERLMSAGHDVTCMVRNSSRVSPPLAMHGRVIQADPLQPDTLPPAFAGIEVAYYLIHSMSGREDGFEERDRRAAHNFAVAAKQAGVKRVIYLGGLATQGSAVSAHLKSRQETGAVLRRFGPPLVEFRAAVIVGNGSISFEIIRCLAERLPVMICPRWVITRTQPIAIDDVLAYLVAALELREPILKPVEIGGTSIETYRSMMLAYARQRGLKRWLIRVPVLTPRLSSYWLDLVTPVPAAVSRPLIEGLRSESICTSALSATLFPLIRPISYEAAVARALEHTAPSLPLPLAGDRDHQTIRAEGVIRDIRETVIDAPPDCVFALLETIGGRNGWFYGTWLWRIRGWLDHLMGGVGMRGRSRTVGLQPGDIVDFWRVERAQAPSTVLLRAEMKLPGAAWLQFDLAQQENGRTLLRCCAWFQPRGLMGEIYWYALYPVHFAIFRGMVRRIRQRCQGTWCATQREVPA